MTCIWSIDDLEAELGELPAVFFVTLAPRGDTTAVVLMLPNGYSLWMSGEGDNVLEIRISRMRINPICIFF